MRFILRFGSFRVEIENSSIYLLSFYHEDRKRGYVKKPSKGALWRKSDNLIIAPVAPRRKC